MRPYDDSARGTPSPSSAMELLPPPGRPAIARESSWASLKSESAYPSVASRNTCTLSTSLSNNFSLSPDPRHWGSDLSPDLVENDDELHNEKPGQDLDRFEFVFSTRGIANLGCLILLITSMVGLFAVYPIATFFAKSPLSNRGGYNVGGINATGQIPEMPGNFGLIDVDTPKSAYTKPSLRDGSEMQLVFSDEFNVEGRSFYPGDDPYFEAESLHYWATNNLEWYDQSAVTTRNGSLEIMLSQQPVHDLEYQGGLVTSWNKFCFTGGYLEASVVLPGTSNIAGLWPAIWVLGNLGRAGYGATLEGMWPYTYDTCDIGTVANQTVNGLPIAATVNGDKYADGVLSYLPGQRLSRCTCPGESHPGPMHEDGTYVGRSAPEIDMFEAQVTGEPLIGGVSQSGQWAPFDESYQWQNTSDNIIINDPTISLLNTYMGGRTQQSSSVVTNTDPRCYHEADRCFSIYGFEYKPGFDNAYITWVSGDYLNDPFPDNKQSWTINSAGMGPNSAVEIGQRIVPAEPMYIIMNLGMSLNFGDVDLEHLTFPTSMLVDYIRLYQPKNAINIGCSPPDFPTAAYIEQYKTAYYSANLTTWASMNQTMPKNRFLGQCAT